MSEIKVGDTFSRYWHFGGKVSSTRTVIKITDKSIWLEDNLTKDVFRIKNDGRTAFYMPTLKGFESKSYYIKD